MISAVFGFGFELVLESSWSDTKDSFYWKNLMQNGRLNFGLFRAYLGGGHLQLEEIPVRGMKFHLLDVLSQCGIRCRLMFLNHLSEK